MLTVLSKLDRHLFAKGADGKPMELLSLLKIRSASFRARESGSPRQPRGLTTSMRFTSTSTEWLSLLKTQSAGSGALEIGKTGCKVGRNNSEWCDK
jgi:hypothetical protein